MKNKQTERASVLVFTAILLPLILFFAGMAVDIGGGYLYKSSLQNAADAAALAGVQAASGRKGRLVTSEKVSAILNVTPPVGALERADAIANKVLVADVGGWQAAGNHVITELRASLLDKEDPRAVGKTGAYYYKVEMTDRLPMRFARLFLPENLFANGWTVTVQSWAMTPSDESTAMSGRTLLEQMLEVENNETISTFQEVKQHFKDHGMSDGNAHSEAKALGFTNPGVLYGLDGTRSETFVVKDTDGKTKNQKSLMINFKPDVNTWAASGQAPMLTGNWDISDIAGMTDEEARNFFIQNQLEFTNLRLYQANGTIWNGEGKYKKWDEMFSAMKNVYGEALVSELLKTRIASIINVEEAYPVRDVESLGPMDVSFDVHYNRNKLDPLFIRIESEEYNAKSGNNYYTNSVRDISINIKPQANNMAEKEYRPILFFYDGPVDELGERGVGRQSRTVVLNLESDFRGVLFAPNSPVQVNGNGHVFQGLIIADRLVDAQGNIIEMPAEANPDTKDELQSFYSRLGLSDAKYDTFGVASLTIYSNPEKDCFFLTERARTTR